MNTPPRPRIWYITAAASILIGVVPILLLERWWGVPRKLTVGFGVIAWVISVLVVKMPLYQVGTHRAVTRGADHRKVSIAHGFLSGFSELGIAAVFFLFVLDRLTLPQLIGFGAGAGMAEAVMLPFIRNPFKGSVLEEHAEETFTRAANDARVQWFSVLERVWATLLHVSSRGLVYVTVLTGNPVPAGMALAGFASVDGVAFYAHLQKWRFDEVPVLARIHVILGVVAAALTAAFLFFAPVVRTRI
jgi:hypothetical protein